MHTRIFYPRVLKQNIEMNYMHTHAHRIYVYFDNLTVEIRKNDVIVQQKRNNKVDQPFSPYAYVEETLAYPQKQQQTKTKFIESIHSLQYLGVTILLSLTVFLNMVAEAMPSTSESVPLIGW